jgi:endoglucanase
VSAAQFADFWSKLAAHYGSNARVVFGLMNEPHDIDVHTWLGAANGAIASIRATGATNLIFVPGTSWTGAATWTTGTGANDNTVMLGVVDSQNNYAYEVHQYLDSDSTGSHTTCVSTTVGTTRIQPFADWLKANGRKGFLGEFGGGSAADTETQDQTCATAIDSMLSLIEANPSLWVGWTYWAGGPWWQAGTSYVIADGATPWELTLLESHL